MAIVSRLRDCRETENGLAFERSIGGLTMDSLNTDAFLMSGPRVLINVEGHIEESQQVPVKLTSRSNHRPLTTPGSPLPAPSVNGVGIGCLCRLLLLHSNGTLKRAQFSNGAARFLEGTDTTCLFGDFRPSVIQRFWKILQVCKILESTTGQFVCSQIFQRDQRNSDAIPNFVDAILPRGIERET